MVNIKCNLSLFFFSFNSFLQSCRRNCRILSWRI